jgi:integrase-like protein
MTSNVAFPRKSRHFAPFGPFGRSGFAAGWGERAGRVVRTGGGPTSKDSGVIPWEFRPLWLDFFGLHSRKGITMSELSNRMIRDMQLAGLVEGTRREYVRGVRQLSAYYMVSPDQLSERNVEDYILYVRDDLGVAKGTFAPMFAGLKFFYLNTLGYDWPLFLKKKSAGHAGSGCPTSAVTRTAAA